MGNFINHEGHEGHEDLLIFLWNQEIYSINYFVSFVFFVVSFEFRSFALTLNQVQGIQGWICLEIRI